LHAFPGHGQRRLQSYPEGERIYINEGWVARITQGVVVLSVAHPDGAEVVIGFLGPNDFIIPHPADSCHVMCMAHTHARVELSSLADELANPEFATAVSARILRADAWAAAQAHPYIEQRLLGILQLISEQFGTPCEHGMLIEIRVTHSLLAAITGATRPTITRILSTLRKSGHIDMVGKGSSVRICVSPATQGPDIPMHP
jgi:CRP-like cAMP-binding protein